MSQPEGLGPRDTLAHRRTRWYRPVSIWRSIKLRPRLFVVVSAGVLMWAILPRSLSVSVRETLVWIIAALVYLGFALRTMTDCTADVMAARSRRIDDSRMVILAIVLLAIASSFLSIAGLINEAKEASRQVKLWYLALASLTIVVSWAVTQVVFAIHYAHEYYRPSDFASAGVLSDGTGEAKRPLDFPGEPNPDYWDFLYFATSIGATSQTSDVAIRGRALRRLVTVHAVVSFFFNATVLALTINLAASLI